MTSSAKSRCASFTSVSVINSKCYLLAPTQEKRVGTRLTARSFCMRGKSDIPVSNVARLFPSCMVREERQREYSGEGRV